MTHFSSEVIKIIKLLFIYVAISLFIIVINIFPSHTKQDVTLIHVIMMALQSTSELIFFPAILTGLFQVLQKEKPNSKYKLTIEVFSTIFLYLVSIALTTACAWSMNSSHTTFFCALKNCYSYTEKKLSADSAIAVIQYIQVLILNAAMLGTFAYIFTSRIDSSQDKALQDEFTKRHPKLVLTGCGEAGSNLRFTNAGGLEITHYQLNQKIVPPSRAARIQKILLENRYILPSGTLTHHCTPDVSFYMQINLMIKSESSYPYFILEKAYYALEKQGLEYCVIQMHHRYKVLAIDRYERYEDSLHQFDV